MNNIYTIRPGKTPEHLLVQFTDTELLALRYLVCREIVQNERDKSAGLPMSPTDPASTPAISGLLAKLHLIGGK